MNIVQEGEPMLINGTNIWGGKWQLVDAPAVELAHHAYPGQLHRFRLYETENNGELLRFAATEVSANVWGFYVPA